MISATTPSATEVDPLSEFYASGQTLYGDDPWLVHSTCDRRVVAIARGLTLSQMSAYAGTHVGTCEVTTLYSVAVVYDGGAAIEFPPYSDPRVSVRVATLRLGGAPFFSHLTHDGCPVYRTKGSK